MATTYADLDGNGQASRSFSFPSIKEADIKVEVDNVTYENRGITGASSGATTFTITSYTTTGGGNIVFDTAPASSANKIRIYRDTDVDSAKATFTAGSAVKAADLNNNMTQILYAAQEEQNQTILTSDIKNAAVTTAKIAADNITAALIADDQINSEHYVAGSIDHEHLANDIIDGDNIQNDVINSEHYVAGSIDHEHLANDIIDGDNIQDNAINSEHYVDASIDHVHLANDVIDGDNIQDDVINSEHIAAGSIDLEHMSANSVDSDQYVDGSIDRVHLEADIIDSTKLADNAVNSEHYVDGSIDHVHLATDVIDGDNIQDDAINSEHIAAGAVDLEHMSANSVDSDQYVDGSIDLIHMSANSVDSDQYVDGSIDSVHIGNDQINSQHYAAGSIDLEHMSANSVDSDQYVDGSIDLIHMSANSVDSDQYVDGSIDHVHLSNDCIDGDNIQDDVINSEHYAADSIDTEHYAAASVDTTALASNAVTTAKITDSNVTTAKVADSNITLAKLASDLKQTSISNSNTQLPTSGAVVSYVAAQIAPLGGLEVIATEVAFPNTQPASGVVISISDAGGVVFNGSGVSTTGRTVGGTTVTINGAPSSLYSETLAAGVGLMVSSTGSSQTYNYHKILGKEDDIKQLSDDINDFNARYRVGSSNPTSNNDAGDLFFNTGSQKLLVYNATNSAWEETQTVGNFFINTISSSSGTGGGSATFNGSAYRFTISNAGTYAQQHIVSINGVVQKPNTGTSQPSEGFAIDGGDIIFSSAPASGADYFIITVGASVSIGTPSDGTVSTAKLANGAVTTAKLADANVTTAKIADDAVTAAKLASDAVVTASIVDANVTTAKIAGDAITGAKIADDAIDSEHYTDGSIDTAHIADDAVTADKLANSINSEIAANTAKTTNATHSGEVTGATALTIADNVVDEANLKVSNSPTNGYFLSAQSGNTGGLTWAQVTTDLVGDTSPQLGGDLDTNGNHILLDDSRQIRFGDDNDMQINHTGSHAYIDNGTGHMYLRGSSNSQILLKPNGSDNSIRCMPGGAVELYDNGSKKLHTTTNGVQVTGRYAFDANNYITCNTTSNTMEFVAGGYQVGEFNSSAFTFLDGKECRFGNGNDLRIHHTSNVNYINSQNGNLALQRSGNTSLSLDGNGDISIPDNRLLYLGSGGDLNLYHDGTDSYIKNQTNGGHLRITNVNSSKAIVFATSNTNRFQISDNGHLIPSANNTHDLGDTSYRWRNVYTNDLHLSNEGSSNDVDSTWGDWTIQEGESDLFLKNNRSGKKYKFNLTEVS